MPDYAIKCEVVEIRSENGTCPGPCRCKLGEVYVLGPRTPEPRGMCGRAYYALHPLVFAMRFTHQLDFKKDGGYCDIVCPDGFVTYRLSRLPAGTLAPQ